MAESKPKYNERLRELLFDAGQQNMNLANLRDRVEDLSNRIDSVITCLASAESTEMKWKAGLDAYILLNVHLQQLSEATKPIMKSYALCPVTYDSEQATRWPELLATLLHPNQESKIQQVKEEILLNEEESIRSVERIDERNEVISDLIKVSRKPNSGVLDPKGPVRKKRNERSSEIRRMIRQISEKEQQSGDKGRKLKRQKRLTVIPADTVSGFGVLTNAFLFGSTINEDKKRL